LALRTIFEPLCRDLSDRFIDRLGCPFRLVTVSFSDLAAGNASWGRAWTEAWVLKVEIIAARADLDADGCTSSRPVQRYDPLSRAALISALPPWLRATSAPPLFWLLDQVFRFDSVPRRPAISSQQEPLTYAVIRPIARIVPVLCLAEKVPFAAASCEMCRRRELQQALKLFPLPINHRAPPLAARGM